jgi:hypothetical protein
MEKSLKQVWLQVNGIRFDHLLYLLQPVMGEPHTFRLNGWVRNHTKSD